MDHGLFPPSSRLQQLVASLGRPVKHHWFMGKMVGKPLGWGTLNNQPQKNKLYNKYLLGITMIGVKLQLAGRFLMYLERDPKTLRLTFHLDACSIKKRSKRLLMRRKFAMIDPAK